MMKVTTLGQQAFSFCCPTSEMGHAQRRKAWFHPLSFPSVPLATTTREVVLGASLISRPFPPLVKVSSKSEIQLANVFFIELTELLSASNRYS